MATFLDTELRKALPDVVVVRSMDWAQTRRENVVRPRLQVEGVVAATARHVVESVAILTGKAMADLIGMAKADADDSADALLPGHQPQVALAALAALTIKSRG